MRDLHKVKEQQGIVLSVSRAYVLLGLFAVVVCLSFIFGYHMGRQIPAVMVTAEVNGHTWYRVRVGSFDTRDGAEKEITRLKGKRPELNPMITTK